MISTPVMFLDVDGGPVVIRDEDTRPDASLSEHVSVNGKELFYRQEVIDRLNRLSSSVDLKWMSGWGKDAVEQLSPALGLNISSIRTAEGAESSMDLHPTDPAKRWWQLNAVMHHIHHDQRPLIWLSPELTNEVQRSVRYIAKFEAVELLMLKTQPTKGISDIDFDRIDMLLSKVS